MNETMLAHSLNREVREITEEEIKETM